MARLAHGLAGLEARQRSVGGVDVARVRLLLEQRRRDAPAAAEIGLQRELHDGVVVVVDVAGDLLARPVDLVDVAALVAVLGADAQR